MSGPITEFREHLAAALTAAVGIPCETEAPARFNPDLIYIDSGEPYIDSPQNEGVPFGYLRLSFEVCIVTRPAENKTQIKRLDDLLELTIATILAEGISFERVGQPINLVTQSGAFPSAVVHVSTTISL